MTDPLPPLPCPYLSSAVIAIPPHHPRPVGRGWGHASIPPDNSIGRIFDRNEDGMNELLTLLNLSIGIAVLGVVAVLLHKTKRIHVKLFALEDEVRGLRTTESANLYRQVQAFISLKDLLNFTVPLPPLRMWAASPDFLLVIARHAL